MGKKITKTRKVHPNHMDILNAYKAHIQYDAKGRVVFDVHWDLSLRQASLTESAIRSRMNRMVDSGLLRVRRDDDGLNRYYITPEGRRARQSGTYTSTVNAPTKPRYQKATEQQMEVIDFLRNKRHDPDAWLTTRMLSERISCFKNYDQAQSCLSTLEKHGLVERTKTRTCGGPRSTWRLTSKGKDAWWDGNYRV